MYTSLLFVKGIHVEDQLQVTYSEVVKLVDIGLVVGIIVMNIFMTFDAENHSIILAKLQTLAISGKHLFWIRKFLSGRKSVMVEGKMISFKEATSDFQGSVLHPVFILIYVNCMAHSVDYFWKASADNFKLYLNFLQSTCVPVLKRMMQLQCNLNKLRSVARSWNLRLNINKRVVMRFGVCNAGNNLGCSYSTDGNY